MEEKKKPGGKKGRSGAQNGVSNNPFGRPVGSKNKVPNPIKKRLEIYIDNNLDVIIAEIEELSGKDRVKAYLDLMKLVVPRPVNQEELDAISQSQSPLIARLFLRKSESEE
ncbi:MAG: hypothetical protein LBT83_03235 [Tannerella sp.]|jgi:hypothetical protein|nr:hypothetical protein [Tannerella sp.]